MLFLPFFVSASNIVRTLFLPRRHICGELLLSLRPVNMRIKPQTRTRTESIPSLFAFRFLLLFPLGCFFQPRLVVSYLSTLQPGRSLFPFFTILYLLALFFW